MSNNSHPYLKCNAIQRIFFTWVSSLFRLGQQRPLEIDDVFEILPDDQSTPWIDRLERAWEHEVVLSQRRDKKATHQASLLWATGRVYGCRYLFIGVLLVIDTTCCFIQPFVLARFIRYFTPCSNMSLTEAVILAALTSIFPWFMFLSRHIGYVRACLAGMHLRCAYSGLIFRKIVRLSIGSLGTHSSGKIVNMLTNDVETVERFVLYGHFIWVGLLETIVIMGILWSRIGVTILLAIIYTTLAFFVPIVCGKCMQLIWATRVRKTDLRIKLMNEIVNSIRLVKMYVWEQPFQIKVERVRRRETFYIICQSLIHTIEFVNGQSFSSIFFLVIFGLLWLQKASFDTDFFTTAFVLISYLHKTYKHTFPTACSSLAKYWVALDRIEKFLLSDEYHRSNAITHNRTTLNDSSAVIEVEQLSATWQGSSFQLQNISFSAQNGDLIMVIGSIASGKSSLLMSILGETLVTQGKISLNENARICYAPQEPWIFSGTIRENVLFGLDYDAQKFQRCIHATALHIDLTNFPYGDSTIVGDNGVILSGGQKSRLSLARALYRDDEIYLLDDPLSAVDVEVARHIFEKCILSKLHSKVCILVTHQIQFLKYATKIVFLDKGNQVAIGSFTELLHNCSAFQQWTEITTPQLRSESTSTNNSSSQMNPTSIPECLTQCSFSEEEEKLLPLLANRPVQQQTPESKRIGSVGWNIFVRYIRAGGCGIAGLLSLFSLFAVTSGIVLASNWWLGRWSNAERIRYDRKNTTNECSVMQQSKISNMTEQEWQSERDRFFYVLLGLSSLSVILLFVRTIAYFISCHITARSLHSQMFNSLLRAPVFFFDSNPIGRVVNRFSKDISSIDEHLSDVTYNFVDSFFNITSTVIFIAFLQPLSLIAMAIVVFMMERVRRIYMPAARDIKRLESLNRSPIYSHLSASIHGVPIIRSYGAQATCVRDFARCLDEHSRVCSIMLGMDRWSAMRIECAVTGFVGFLTFSILLMHRSVPISDLSLILAYSLTLVSSAPWILEAAVDVMMQMTSAERVIEYIDLKPEESPNTTTHAINLPPHWPQGAVVFDDLSFRYSSAGPWVLRNLHLSIRPSEKIGIVGRTGAGKSSIIQSLFRMAELEGRILIDDVDTQKICLYDLRRHISIIPQDPVLLNDTLRINLDPFGEYSDIEIWSALDEVQLNLNTTEGLRQQVTEGGSNFSVGQRQLICLARALLRKNRILVIDEATANVDHRTDELIQISIRRKFLNCTILTIAHRLRTIIDSDKVLVLSHGQVVEFGCPYELLCDERSQFAQLVSQTGDTESTHLIQQAKLAAMARQFR